MGARWGAAVGKASYPQLESFLALRPSSFSSPPSASSSCGDSWWKLLFLQFPERDSARQFLLSPQTSLSLPPPPPPAGSLPWGLPRTPSPTPAIPPESPFQDLSLGGKRHLSSLLGRGRQPSCGVPEVCRVASEDHPDLELSRKEQLGW